MQPTFNPWIGYFELINSVDTFIFLDTVQLNQQSWQTRNKVKAQNKELMVSIPIKKSKNKSELTINEAHIDFSKFDFRKKLMKTLEQNYIKSKYFDEVHDFVKELVLFDTQSLSEYNINMITRISKKLNIETEFIILSQTDYMSHKNKSDLVLDICKYFGADEYYSPIGSKEYLEKSLDDFNLENIQITYQNYSHPKYNQRGVNFIPYIGILDLLFNEGMSASLDIINSGVR